MDTFNGRVAVVTGGGSGIGEGIATVLSKAGAHVIIADRAEDRVDVVCDRLRRSTGGEVLGIVTDVSDPTSVEGLAEAAYAKFGAVHLLFNNAGTTSVGAVWETPLEDWKRVLEVNLFGCIHGIRSFVPRMIAGGDEGHIVNTSSMAGVTPIPLKGPYVASKWAIIGLSKTLQYDLIAAGAKISVSVVCPGPVATTMTADTLAYYDNRPISAADRAKLVELRDFCNEEGISPEEAGTIIVEAVRRRHFWALPSGQQFWDAAEAIQEELRIEGFGRPLRTAVL